MSNENEKSIGSGSPLEREVEYETRDTFFDKIFQETLYPHRQIGADTWEICVNFHDDDILDKLRFDNKVMVVYMEGCQNGLELTKFFKKYNLLDRDGCTYAFEFNSGNKDTEKMRDEKPIKIQRDINFVPGYDMTQPGSFNVNDLELSLNEANKVHQAHVKHLNQTKETGRQEVRTIKDKENQKIRDELFKKIEWLLSFSDEYLEGDSEVAYHLKKMKENFLEVYTNATGKEIQDSKTLSKEEWNHQPHVMPNLRTDKDIKNQKTIEMLERCHIYIIDQLSELASHQHNYELFELSQKIGKILEGKDIKDL